MSAGRGGLERMGRGGGWGRLLPWRWNWPAIVRADPTRLLDDVFARPSVAPVAAWLLSALIGLVAFLTWRYAAGAAERANLPHGADLSGVISEDVGRLTIVAVAALALIAGWEPIAARRVFPAIGRWIAPFFAARAWYISWPRNLVGAPLLLLWRLPSMALSLLDWALARPFALLAGVRIADWVGSALSPWCRYAILAFWIAGAGVAATRLDGALALWALLPGFLAVFAVVRRWTWVERDREAFLIERGGPAHRRVGFQEDLRDEALTAMVGLFALIPIGLRQIDMSFGAFDLVGVNGEPIAGEPSLWQWAGFFGAELAKSVPFVDWSEVYHVANGSPIEAHEGSPLGATLVFLLRATLDLLLLAAVLQAVQIAARVRDQNQAFRAGNLPILDPFAELAAFRPLARRDLDKPILRKLADAVADFPNYGGTYDERRLAEIVAGGEPALKASLEREGDGGRPISPVERDSDARDAAMLVAACRHPLSPLTAKILSAVALRNDGEEARRARALELLADANPQAAEAPLIAVATDREAAPGLRLQALRDLGRLRRGGAVQALSALAQEEAAHPALRVHAGLALAKFGASQFAPASDAVARIASRAENWEAAMPIAHALALVGRTAEIAALFSVALKGDALRAAKSALGEWDKMAAIKAGEFAMGAAPGETDSFPSEYPQHGVSVPAFELGVYAVTFEEYDAFCDATGRERPDDQNWGRERRPVINVSWEDAHAYSAWLNAWSGERFRLPSEAEWEYACRAGTATPFSFSETISTAQANYDGNYTYGAGAKGEYREQTLPVGSFAANGGLYDMHGNVWEWCADAWNENYTGAPSDGSAWLTGAPSLRVRRGGSWYDRPQNLRSAGRRRSSPTIRNFIIGFRVARTVLPR